MEEAERKRVKERPEVAASTPLVRKFLQACVDGDLEKVEALDNENRTLLLTATCTSGCKALHWAAGSGQLDTVDYILRQKVDVDQRATKDSKGRTALHYACRNGHVAVARFLVENGANLRSQGKKGVTPFQLAVWQNRLPICRFLVEECGLDPRSEVNDFQCSLVHWLGLIPETRSGPDGIDILPLARWLDAQGVDFQATQKQGHTALHKAAWGGHMELCRYLYQVHGMYDDRPDGAGNYAVDLATMGKKWKVAEFLRRYCSRDRQESCNRLELNSLEDSYNHKIVRKAFHRLAKHYHPDSLQHGDPDKFNEIYQAYIHLTQEQGVGRQRNKSHQLVPLLSNGDEADTLRSTDTDDDFELNLHVVLREYGQKGIDISNLRKKWEQVWPDLDFPDTGALSLSEWVATLDGFHLKRVNNVPRIFSVATQPTGMEFDNL